MNFITEEDELVINKKGLHCLYFYGQWVPFHKKMIIMLQKMEEQFEMKYDGIDVDYFKPLCKRFEITSVPTVLILKNGKEYKRIVGMVMTSACRATFLKAVVKKKEEQI